MAVVGCSAAPPLPTEPVPSTSAVTTVPSDGVLLSSLGYVYAPDGFSIPSSSIITERVDQENTVVAVFTAPRGEDVASYLREALPGQGWKITADGDDSLLFEREQQYGAFTVAGEYAALSLRWDARS